MTAFRQYLVLSKINLLSHRQFIIEIAIIQVVAVVGIVLGFGYFMPSVTDERALYLTVGAATNAVVTIGLVALPQTLSMSKEQGRLEYLLTLPISREAYLLGEVTLVAVMALPSVAFALALGQWRYGIDLRLDALVIPAILLTLLSLAGVGVAVGILPARRQVSNTIAQLVVFAVPLFTPVLMPASQFPGLLRGASHFLPTTYAADALRATLTDLPATHAARSLAMMAAFSIVSLTVSAWSVRRRG